MGKVFLNPACQREEDSGFDTTAESSDSTNFWRKPRPNSLDIDSSFSVSEDEFEIVDFDIEDSDIENIEASLNKEEKISLFFLMSSVESLPDAYDNLEYLLNNYTENMIYVWLKNTNINDWKYKFMESLLVMKKENIFIDKGVEEDTVKELYNYLKPDKSGYSVYLNPILKTLYFLCRINNEGKELFVGHLFKEKDIQHDELELYLLYLMKKKDISIYENSGDLEKLVTTLEKFKFNEKSQTYRSLKKWNETYSNKNSLCLLISMQNFQNKEKDRTIFQRDVDRLSKIHQQFGFQVKEIKNLTGSELAATLKSVGEYTKEDYDCIIIYILSHGNKGAITTSDNLLISLEDIQDAICTPQLKNVLKFLIISACQGKHLGCESQASSRDENAPIHCFSEKIPCSNILRDNIRFSDTAMFVSSIPEFSSLTDTKHSGSLFINVICDVLENVKDSISLIDFTVAVKNQLSKKRIRKMTLDGKLYFNIGQTAEVVNDRLRKHFIFQRKKN